MQPCSPPSSLTPLNHRTILLEDSFIQMNAWGFPTAVAAGPPQGGVQHPTARRQLPERQARARAIEVLRAAAAARKPAGACLCLIACTLILSRAEDLMIEGSH